MHSFDDSRSKFSVRSATQVELPRFSNAGSCRVRAPERMDCDWPSSRGPFLHHGHQHIRGLDRQFRAQSNQMVDQLAYPTW